MLPESLSNFLAPPLTFPHSVRWRDLYTCAKGCYPPLWRTDEFISVIPLFWGNMASTPSKVSSSGASKAAPRTVSQTRLVAAKGAQKSQKPSVPPKAKGTGPAGHPPASTASSIGKPRRWSKDQATPAAESATDTEAELESSPEERSSRSGLTKSELKAQFAKLSAATAQIGVLKRTLGKSFVDVGTLLNQIRIERLYEVKGYGSFESFVEREIDIAKAVCFKLVRIAETLQRDPALAAGLERASAAVAALDGEGEASLVGRPGGSPAGGVPLHKQ
jgi:hypothetical protein